MRRRSSLLAGALLAAAFAAVCVAALLTRNPAVVPFQPPADGGAGSSVVTLSRDAAANEQGENVRSLLQRHYDAINTRNYGGWRDTVVDERSDKLAEADWNRVYDTTADGSVHVERIDVGPAGADGRTTLLVMVRFVSTQDPALAPEQARAPRDCWHSTLPLTGSPWRIGVTAENSSVPEVC